MTDSSFTPRQRRIVLLMVLIIVAVFALLAGFIITSVQSWRPVATIGTPETLPVNELSSPAPSPTAMPTQDAIPAPKEGIWSQVRAARLFNQIAYQVEIKRELSPRAEVPLSFLDHSDMTGLLIQLYERRDLASVLLPYRTLGMLPDAPLSVGANPSTGVYVSEQGQLYVVIDGREDGDGAQALLAHAYVHALQDQHFDLEAMDSRAISSDAQLAVEALIEGDATLLTALYLYDDLSDVEWDHLTDLIIKAEQPSYDGGLLRTDVLAELERFANREGRAFVEALFKAGGWQAVNEAYADPPRSTEQILHPSRYLAERDRPTRVVIPDLGSALGEGWRAVREETIGEFVTQLYLDQHLPEERARQAAAGWDGDTLVIWEGENGRRIVVWRTIWDANSEARAFESALVASVPQRHFPVETVPSPRGLPGEWWETNAGGVHVHRAARYVLFVHAPDINTVANVMEVLP